MCITLDTKNRHHIRISKAQLNVLHSLPITTLGIMYSKAEFGIHGLLALVCLPFLWLKDKISGFVPKEPLQKKKLVGFVCVVTGKCFVC